MMVDSRIAIAMVVAIFSTTELAPALAPPAPGPIPSPTNTGNRKAVQSYYPKFKGVYAQASEEGTPTPTPWPTEIPVGTVTPTPVSCSCRIPDVHTCTAEDEPYCLPDPRVTSEGYTCCAAGATVDNRDLPTDGIYCRLVWHAYNVVDCKDCDPPCTWLACAFGICYPCWNYETYYTACQKYKLCRLSSNGSGGITCTASTTGIWTNSLGCFICV